MPYELTTLTGPVLGAGTLSERARAWMAQDRAEGECLGIWRSDIGVPGRLFVLREFEDAAALARERMRALMSDDPFNCRDIATDLSMESYEGFAFLPAARRGSYGGVFELRTYHLKIGGLPPTLAGWEAAIEPARTYTDHLVTNMFALDGPPRITHIWGFSSVEERLALRADHFGRGLWPPENGPDNIRHATSVIAMAEEGWPIS